MTNPRPLCVVALTAVTLASACNPTHHLGKDYGVSYESVFLRQADRATLPGRDHALYGREGVQIRLRAQEAATAEKSATIHAD